MQESWEAGNCLYIINSNGNTLLRIIIPTSCQPELSFHCTSCWASKPTNSQKCLGKEGGGKRRKPSPLPTTVPSPHPLENIFLNKSRESPIYKIFHSARWAETPKTSFSKKKKKRNVQTSISLIHLPPPQSKLDEMLSCCCFKTVSEKVEKVTHSKQGLPSSP